MLIDTDVLIWLHRGHKAALNLVEADPAPCIALQTALEFLQAAPSRRKQDALRSFMTAADISILPLSENIGHRALILIEEHSLGHGMRAGDALIAATALEHGIPLCSANHKHFKMISGLQVKVFKP